jgi:isopenicillin N synthase-like dioxygenase
LLLDIAPLVKRIDDPNMTNDKDVLQVVKMLDGACKNVGFFYVVRANELWLMKQDNATCLRHFK